MVVQSPYLNEWVKVAQVPVYGDDHASNFSPVLDGGSVDVSILSLEQSCNPGSRELVFVTWFIPEQNDVSNLRSLALFLPIDFEATTGNSCVQREAKTRREVFQLVICC